MANKQIITSEKELAKLIGCAADLVAEREDVSQKKEIISHAAQITLILCDHFSGREKIPEELLEMYDAIAREQDKMLTSVFVLFDRFR